MHPRPTARPARLATGVLLLAASVTTTLVVAGPPASADPAGRDRATCLGRPATVLGTDGADRLAGTAGRDVVAAGEGDDVVRGLGGDDLVCGGPGYDVLDGGAGRDTLVGGADGTKASGKSRGDLLDGGAGGDLLLGDQQGSAEPVGYVFNGPDVATYERTSGPVRGDLADVNRQSGASLTTATGVDRLRRIGVVVGTAGEDHLRTTANPRPRPARVRRPAVLIGGPGADRLRGPYLVGGRGDDRLTVPDPGPDQGPGVDRASGGGGDDLLRLSGAFVRGEGGPGRDQLQAGVDDGFLGGGSGRDRIVSLGDGGGAGDDEIQVDPGPGADAVRVRGSSALVYAEDADRSIVTGGGDDEVRLASLPRSLDLGAGQDLLSLLKLGGDQVPGSTTVRVDLARGTLAYQGRTSRSVGAELVQGARTVRNIVVGSARDETIFGGCYSDRVVGGAGDDDLYPATGSDVVRGGPGDDLFYDYPNGSCYYANLERPDDDDVATGVGRDTVEYYFGDDTLPHVVDLAAGTASMRGDDLLSGAEVVRGLVNEPSILRGSPGPDELLGRNGADDVLVGRGGDDVLLTSARARGTRADGGPGTDVCRAVVVVDCESEPTPDAGRP